MFERKKYKNFAKIQLKGRWKVPVIMTLIVAVVTGILNIPDYINTYGQLSLSELKEILTGGYQKYTQYISSLNPNTSTSFIISIIQIIASFIFTYATLNVFLIMSRSPEPITLKNFFEGMNDWVRGILTGLWQLLWIFLWIMLCALISTLLLTGLIGALQNVINQNILTVVAPILIFVCCIPCFIKLIAYSQTFYIAVEYQDVSITQALKLSIRITNGHKMDIFITDLTFIGWFLLGFLSLGIANLWITPYYRMTMTNVYHALMKEALEKGVVKPEELVTNNSSNNSDDVNTDKINSDDVNAIEMTSKTDKENMEISEKKEELTDNE